MSKVISVLEKMASDATMNGESAIADLVSTSDINEDQQQAIIENDVEKLTKLISNLPIIRSVFPLIPAEDDEPEDDVQEDDNTEKNILLAMNA